MTNSFKYSREYEKFVTKLSIGDENQSSYAHHSADELAE